MAYERLTVKDIVNVLKDTEYLLPIDKIYLRLAELEDKIEDGNFIEPPFKIGDHVFGIDLWILNHVGAYRAIKDGIIVYIDARITAEKIIYYYCIEYFDNIFKVNDTKSRSVCSHVFTTKEDAEAKLEELKKQIK